MRTSCCLCARFCLAGIAAEGLEAGSRIASRTLASLEFGWKDGRDMLTSRDVLVID